MSAISGLFYLVLIFGFATATLAGGWLGAMLFGAGLLTGAVLKTKIKL